MTHALPGPSFCLLVKPLATGSAASQGPLCYTSTSEYVVETVVPFVTGILVERLVVLLHEELVGPGSRPHRRIIERGLVQQRLL